MGPLGRIAARLMISVRTRSAVGLVPFGSQFSADTGVQLVQRGELPPLSLPPSALCAPCGCCLEWVGSLITVIMVWGLKKVGGCSQFFLFIISGSKFHFFDFFRFDSMKILTRSGGTKNQKKKSFGNNAQNVPL